MGFSSLEVARSRGARPLKGAAASISPNGYHDKKFPTVKVFLYEDIMEAAGLKFNDRVSILQGTGADFGKIRLEKHERGDVRVRMEAAVTSAGVVSSRLLPNGGVARRRKEDIPAYVVAPGVVELIFPWLQGHEETIDETKPEGTKLAKPGAVKNLPQSAAHIAEAETTDEDLRETGAAGVPSQSEDPWS